MQPFKQSLVFQFVTLLKSALFSCLEPMAQYCSNPTTRNLYSLLSFVCAEGLAQEIRSEDCPCLSWSLNGLLMSGHGHPATLNPKPHNLNQRLLSSYSLAQTLSP